MLVEFTLPIFPWFYKFDFSTIPVIIGTFAMGPLAGVTIQLIKDIANMLISSDSAGIGQLADFVIGSAYIIPAGIIYKHIHTQKGALIGCTVGTITATIAASLFNYYVLIPVYAIATGYTIADIVSIGTNITRLIKDLKTLILFATVPFNIMKFSVISLITMLTYKKVSPLLKLIRKNNR